MFEGVNTFEKHITQGTVVRYVGLRSDVCDHRMHMNRQECRTVIGGRGGGYTSRRLVFAGTLRDSEIKLMNF